MTTTYVLSSYILSIAIATIFVLSGNKTYKHILSDDDYFCLIFCFVLLAPLTLPLGLVLTTGIGIGVLIYSITQLKNPLSKKKNLN